MVSYLSNFNGIISMQMSAQFLYRGNDWSKVGSLKGKLPCDRWAGY